MIPLLAVVRVRGPVRFSLWLPLFLIWIVLLPFALVLFPFAIVVLAARRIAVWPVIAALFDAFSGMRGTFVDVRTPGNSVFVHIC